MIIPVGVGGAALDSRGGLGVLLLLGLGIILILLYYY